MLRCTKILTHGKIPRNINKSCAVFTHIKNYPKSRKHSMQPAKLHHLLRANHSPSRGYTHKQQATASEKTSNHLDGDCRDCQTRKFMGTELMMCQMEITQCAWAIPYKNELYFCKHPTASQFNSSIKAWWKILITTEIRKAEQTQFGARNHEGMAINL